MKPSDEVIRAGQYRDFVTFKIRPDTQDTSGHVEQFSNSSDLETWETRTEVYGLLESMTDRGREFSEGRRDVSEEFMVLSIRYDEDTYPQHTDAVMCEGRQFDIVAIHPVGNRKRKVSLTLREVI